MKFKKVMLICILLVILTIGAASAQDSLNDTTTQNQEDGMALVEDTDYSVHVPSEYMDSTYYGSDIAGVENMPCDAEGNISITVDEMERYNRKVVSGPNAISLGELNLDYGNHSISIKYTGDGKYGGFLKNCSFERVYLGVECPKDFTKIFEGNVYTGENTLDVTLAKGVTGSINVLIDNKSVYNKKYDAENPPKIDLNKYGGYHTYEVRYFGGNQRDVVKKGSFNSSIFYIPYYPSEITYGDSVRFELDMSFGSRGVARVNNKSYEFEYGYESYPDVILSGFEIGENVVEFTLYYMGVSQTINCTVFVSPKITLPEVMKVNKTYNLTFEASEWANGDLILSGMINDTVEVTSGKATVQIPGQDAGNYTLNLSYENYTWSYDVHVAEAPKVVIYFNYYKEIHPWNSWYDDDPDHYDFMYYISVWAYPSCRLTGNTEIYLDGVLKENFTGDVDKCHLWPDYYAFGNHTIRVEYKGDDTFEAVNETYSYTVSPYECYVDEYGTVCVTVDEGVSGTLTIKANNKTYTKTIKASDWSESYYYSLKNLTKDKNYAIDVNFKASKGYEKYSFSKTLNFTLTCPIVFSGGDYIYGYEDSIVFYVPKDLKNKVNVYINGSSYNYKKYDGEYNYWIDETTQTAYEVDISNLKPRLHNVSISYLGDDKYPPASINETINITAKIDWIDGWEDEEDAKVSICLPADAKGNLTMEIKYDGESNYALFKTVALKEGKAEIILPIGNYDYIVYYSGDDYQVDEWDYFEVNYPSVSYKGRMNYGQSYKFKVNDDVNGTLVFYLGWDTGARLPVAWFDLTQGKTVSVDKKLIDKALSHNMAKLIMNNNYANEGYYTLDLHPVICSDIGTFDFEPIYIDFAYKITGAANVNIYYTASKTISLKVYNLYGKLVGKNQIVKIKIGKYVKNVKTNKNGVAKFKIPTTITPGKYKMTITYKNKKVTKKLTVKQILSIKTVKVKKSAKKLVLTATLKKVNGKYLKGKRVTFKFNGKTYKANTNKKGVAKYTIKKSVLKKLKVGKKVKYQATYLKTTVKKTAKVKK